MGFFKNPLKTRFYYIRSGIFKYVFKSGISRKIWPRFINTFYNALQVSGLNSGRGLKITIYAANSNGRSRNVVLEGFTLKVAELQVGKAFFE